MPTILYSGTNFALPNLGLGTPAGRRLAYGQLPVPFSVEPAQPFAIGAGTGTLNTNNPSSANTGYAGYTNYDPTTLNLLPSFTTKLDGDTGFNLAFTLQINTEASNPNRAGFSLMVTSANQTGIELGFRTTEIFSQASNFTEFSNFGIPTTVARNYTLQVVNGQYTLLDGGATIGNFVNRSLISYNFTPALSTPPLPFNPYTSPNFLFFGDNTDQGNANFTISTISVNALPVAKPESYQTPASTALNIPVGSGVLANDSDADADLLTAVLVTPPSQGSLALNSNGSFTYTPNAGVNAIVATTAAIDTFQYRVKDSAANSRDVVTTSITVGNLPVPLSIDVLKLLTNPPAPPTPAPIIVGTPPLNPETPMVIGTPPQPETLLPPINPRDFGYPNTGLGNNLGNGSGANLPDEEIIYYGTPEDDAIVGTAKREAFFGFGKKDLLRGGKGNDRFFGGRGADTIFGGAGNDNLRGGKGNDYLNGGSGDDFLTGGKGKNILVGGKGSDRFSVAEQNRFQIGKGQDTIVDFVPGEDSLELISGLTFGDLVQTSGVGATVISTRPNALNPNFQAIAALVGVSSAAVNQLGISPLAFVL